MEVDDMNLYYSPPHTATPLGRGEEEEKREIMEDRDHGTK